MHLCSGGSLYPFKFLFKTLTVAVDPEPHGLDLRGPLTLGFFSVNLQLTFPVPRLVESNRGSKTVFSSFY